MLGRDAILRKTMLDECKGERLEEVLASFSTAVLKKVVTDDIVATGEHPSPALRLALENRGYREEKSDLVALTLAHRASLHRLLEDKKAAKARYEDFADFMGIKDRSVARRSEQIRAKGEQPASTGKTISDEARAEMRRTVRNNWAGNERWMETLLSGDAGASKEGLLATPFDRVWRRVQQGRLAELEESGSGLLEQLDSRVRTQRERLQRWEVFRKRNFGEQPRASPSKPKTTTQGTKGINFGFGAHEAMHLGRMSPSKDTLGIRPPSMDEHYSGLVQGLEEELNSMRQDRADPLEFLKRWEPDEDNHVRSTLSVDAGTEEAISELSEMEEDDMDTFPAQAPIKSFQSKLQGAKRLPIRPNLSSYKEESESQKGSSSSVPRAPAIPQQDEYQGRSPTRSISPPIPTKHYVPPATQSPSRDDPMPTPPTAEPDETVLSPTQDLANHILESMNNTSPSPTKSRPRHTLSLAERTRLSMARGHSAFFAEDEPEPELPLGPATANVSSPPFESDSKTLVGEEHEDLASRTRRSMAGFDKARQKAQVERRRSVRRSKLPPRREGSYFPKLDEETQDQSMLMEELGEDDMEAVFKSRPKIKASPLPSPTREWDEE